MVSFPAFLQLETRDDGSAGRDFLSAVDRLTTTANARLSEFSKSAERQLDAALGGGRSAGGGIDLGVAQMQRAAEVQRFRAVTAREVAEATLAAARAQGAFDQATRESVAAARSLANAEEAKLAVLDREVTTLSRVQAQLDQTAGASRRMGLAGAQGAVGIEGVGASSRRSQIAMLQAGQQMQDFTVQIAGGARASTALIQQLPQMAFALSGLEGSTNKAANRIGQLGTFLSGPWGVAVGLGVFAVGGLIASLLQSGAAADEATAKLQKNAEEAELTRQAKARFQKTEEGVTAAILDQKEALDKNAASLATAAERARDEAKANLDSEIAIRSKTKSILEQAAAYEARHTSSLRNQLGAEGSPGFDIAAGTAAGRVAQLEKRIATQDSLIATARSNLARAQSNFDVEAGKRAADPLEEIRRRYEGPDGLIEAARKRAVAEGLVGAALQKQIRALVTAQKIEADAASKRLRPGRTTRDPGELSTFISPVAGGRISGQFGEQRPTHRHGGVDIAVPVGTQVKAPAGGVIIESGTVPGYGNVVLIDHGGGTITRLAHLSKLGAKEGDLVAQGDIVGLSGGARGAPGSGNSRGPHLHQETRVNGRAVNPLTGRFPTDSFGVADRAQDAAEKAFAKQNAAADALLGRLDQINARFADQPRFVSQAELATKELDDTIADMAARLSDPDLDPQLAEKFARAKAEAERAKGAFEDALVRPIRELAEESAKRIQVDTLMLAGREREARVLQTIWQIEERRGQLKPAERAQVEAIVAAEERHLEVVRKLQDQQNAYLDATRSIRGELENLFAGESVDFGRIFRRLQAQITVENLFGDTLRKLDLDVKAKFDTTKAQQASDALATGLYELDAAVRGTAETMRNPANVPSGSSPSRAAAEDIWWDLMASGSSRAANDNGQSEIVVTGTRDADAVARGISRSRSALGLSPDAFANMLGVSLVAPLLRGLPPAIAGPLSRILGGAAGGYATGGAPGGILGAVKGGLMEFGPDIFGKGLNEKLLKGVDGAMAGAATGTMVSGISNALGIKMNSTGAQIGGAIGSFIPIPGGQIIGSIAGGLLGNAFGKRPRGAGSVTNSGVTGSTNDSELTKALTGMGSDIQGAVKRIADALGAELGAFDVGIGRYKDYYQVSSKAGDPKLGNSYFGRDSKFALYDGKDEAAATVAALAEAIRDGAVKGLSATAERILKTTPDVDAAIEKILNFQSVFKRLRAYKDPVGAAIDELEQEFGKLRDIFKSAGASAAEYAQLEELYGIERAKAVKDAMERATGAMRGLLDELTIGDSGLSLRDRQANARAQYDGLATRVRAGDATAYDDFAARARDLLDIERQIYGSTQAYFDRFNEVKGLTQGVLDQQQALADKATARDTGADMHVVRDAVDSQTNVLGGKLDTAINLFGAMNDNLITFARQSAGSGGKDSLASRYGLSTELR